MSNQDTAQQLGITRQAVHNSLKKTVPKIYKIYKQKYNTEPYDTIQEIIFGLDISDDKDISSFYKYLNDKQKTEIMEDIRKRGIHV